MRLPRSHDDIVRGPLGLRGPVARLDDDPHCRRWLDVTAELFAPDRLAAILDPLAPAGAGAAADAPERIARQWLTRGGKRLRPLITIAATASVTGAEGPEDLPRALWPIAVAVEAFHKASLIHDDIEDDDLQRYGEPTLHRSIGAAAAINAGDYLLGLGYRLASTAPVGDPARQIRLMNLLSESHVRLARGQGLELSWRSSGRYDQNPAEVLRAYACKTATAFEAAMAGGLILAGRDDADRSALSALATQMGVGFQLRNDLADWDDDCRAGRATWLTARAMRRGGGAELSEAVAAASRGELSPAELAQRFDRLGVFADAARLVLRLRERCLNLARNLQGRRLARLCEFLTECILGPAGCTDGGGS